MLKCLMKSLHCTLVFLNRIFIDVNLMIGTLIYYLLVKASSKMEAFFC